MVRSERVRWEVSALMTAALLAAPLACSSRPIDPPNPSGPPPGAPAPTSAASVAGSPTAPTRPSAAPEAAEAAAAQPSPCPEDMVFVEGTYCTNWRRRCLKSENEKSNHLTICHRFDESQTCVGKTRRQQFCIDRYEYPSRKGAHPPVMVSAYDAAALCSEKGKRLCWESEWITACEGPEGKPFPYGRERDNTKCNIDRRWRKPALKKVHGNNRELQARELARLDQSVRSGSMETCQSDYGVYDLTGNQDEWVLTEAKRGTSEWIGLKGGNWHHVRNACRPMTTSHAAQWSYYFVSFRCCKDPDAAGVKPVQTDGAGPPLWTPPPAPTPAPPFGGRVHRGWSPDLVGEEPQP